MKFKEIIDSPCGIRYIAESLELQSTASRIYLMEREMMTTVEKIGSYHSRLRKFIGQNNTSLKSKLHGVRYIGNTIKRVLDKITLSDVELFEIKELSMISESVKGLVDITMPELGDVISILDPDKINVPSFYVYDSYCAELSKVRKELKNNPELIDKVLSLELVVRKRLTEQLLPYANRIEEAMNKLFEIDILVAQAEQMSRESLVLPTVYENGSTQYIGLVNPQVRSQIKTPFQAVNISFDALPTTIIGANMGGKTITLRSLTLAQYSAQFGFGVAADRAMIGLKEEIYLSVDTSSSVGFSSFATEMKNIDTAIKAVKKGGHVLVLIDEPARTTNPIEGRALVEALIEVCQSKNSNLVITTHYNIENKKCHRLKVKGFIDNKMDYSFEEVAEGEVPHEAIRVAETLGINGDWLEQAKNRLKNE